MKYLEKVINGITKASKWGAMLTIFLMMLLISITVLSRSVFQIPIVGDYELVQLMMVLLVGLGFAYSEATDSHIKVGLIVDRFGAKTQNFIDILVYILVAAICCIIGTIQLKAGLTAISTFKVSTAILHIPHYPFQFLLAIGFYAWGLEAVLKIIRSILFIVMGKGVQQTGGDVNVS